MSPPDPKGKLVNRPSAAHQPEQAEDDGERSVGIGKQVLRSLKETIFSQEWEISCPFPPAKFLQEYKEVDPELYKVVVAAFTDEPAARRKLQAEEAEHRRKLELADQAAQHKDLEAARTAERRGQFIAMWVCVFIVGCGTVTAIMGQPIAGGAIGSGAVVMGVVNAFLLRRTPEAAAVDRKANEKNSDPPPADPAPPATANQLPQTSTGKKKPKK